MNISDEKMITLFGSNVGNQELEAISKVFENQWIGHGKKTVEFEEMIARKCRAPGFVFMNSGSNALQAAIRILDLPKNSEIILPSFTWIACANAAILEGLKPVFCDVDLNTCNVRADDIEAKVTKRTSAIMVVHYAGKPVNMVEILDLGFPVIEDAAHAIDSSIKGRHCGTIGTVGVFSFDAVKNLTTGEGGGVVSLDDALLERARRIRYCGIEKSGFESSSSQDRWWEYKVSEAFPKMLNTDIAASIGLEQLKKLKKNQMRRQEIWTTYTEVFRKEDWANSWISIPPGAESNEDHSYFTYCIKLTCGSRDCLASFLLDRKIYTSLRYHPLHLVEFFRSNVTLPNSETLNEVALNLPLHQRLTNGDLDKIFSALKEFSKQI